MNENNDNKQNEPSEPDIKSAIETKSTSFRDKLAMFKQKAEKPSNPPPFKRASFTKPIETSSKIKIPLQKNVEKINEEQPAKDNTSFTKPIEESTKGTNALQKDEEKINEEQLPKEEFKLIEVSSKITNALQKNDEVQTPKEQFRPIEVSSKITMSLQKNEEKNNEEQPLKDKFRPIEVSKRITMALHKKEEKSNEEPAKENISKIDIPRKSQNFSALQESIKLRFTKTMGSEAFKPFGFKKEEPKPTVEPIKEEPTKQEENPTTPKIEENNVKAEELNQDDTKNLVTFIDNSFGREFFLSAIFQNKAHERVTKNITKQCFSLLSDGIFNSLLTILKLDGNEKNFLDAIMLIKSTMLYFKSEKKKKIFICDILFEKLKNFSLISKDDLWEQWLDFDLQEKKELGIIYKDVQEEEKAICELLFDMTGKQMKLKRTRDNIFTSINNIAMKRINTDKTYDDFKKKLVKMIK